MQIGFWTADELENMPTISASQFDDLKIETSKMRVWLSRMTPADGAEFRRGVAIEVLRDGKWEIAHEYEGANARQEVLEHYDVNAEGTITSPGKLEGQPIYTPHLWELALDGEGEDEYDEDGRPVTTLKIEEWDSMEFPEIAADDIKWVQLWEDEQGFVNIVPLEEARARA